MTAEEVAEFDSPATIQALEEALQTWGVQVERIGNGQRLAERLVHGDRWDLVFNIAEGLRGRSREAQVPALLELYGVPYTFSDSLVCALTLDKALTKQVIRAAGLPTPRFQVVTSEADVARIALNGWLFVKPVAEGTGKGVDRHSRVRTRQQLLQVCRRLLHRFHQPVLVEDYLPGREFTTGVLGSDRNAHALGTLEIRVRSEAKTREYSYAIKEQCERWVCYLPLEQGPLRRKIEALALRVHRVLNCRDASRVDFRLDAFGRPSFLEINPLPGLHPTHSDLPMIAAQEGLTYRDLIGAIVRSACARIGKT